MVQKHSQIKSRRRRRLPVTSVNSAKPSATDLLRSIAATSSAHYGDRYFHSLTRYLSRTLGMAYAFVSELARDRKNTLNVLSACLGGKIGDNFSYGLAGTPCEHIMRRGFCTFPSNVQQQFPEDRYLVDHEVECYVGVPLHGSNGRPLGLIAVMDRKPLRNRETVELVLQIVAARTATEIERQHLHQDLGESYRTLATLIANLPGMVYRCRNDAHWTLEFASEGVLNLTGYAPNELIQNRVVAYADLIHPDDRAAVWDSVQAALAVKQPFELKYRIVTKTGKERHVWEQGRGVFTPDGALLALEGYITDISDRAATEHALQHNEKLLRTVMDALPVGVWIADRSGRLVSANPAGRTIWAGAKYVGMEEYGEYKGWWADTGKPIAPEEWALARAITHGEISVNEVINIECFDGTRKTIFNSAIPIHAPDGAIDGAVVVNQDITAMVQAQKALEENAQFLDRSQRIANVGSWEWDVRTNQVKWSDEMYRVYGLKKDEFDGTFASAMALTHPEDVPKIERIVERMLHQGTTATMEYRLIRPDGKVRWALGQSEPILDQNGKLIRIVGAVRDITERKLAEDALWENEVKFRTLFESAKDAIFLFKDGQFVDCNPETLRMFGCRRHEILGKGPVQFSPEYQPNGRLSKEMALQKIEAAYDGTPQFFEWVHSRLDGTPFHTEVSLNRIEIQGERYLQAIVHDITERNQAQERLQYLAHHDSLTGLPNRAMFLERLNHALARARWTKRILAVLFLDLDRFKNINDTLGHDIGDTALRVAAERLIDCVREGDTVARLGGDEFTVLLEDLADRNDVPSVAQKILDALCRPFEVEGREFVVTTSIGISIYPEDGDDSLKLLRNADTAMYRAKEQGRNKFQFYSSEMSAKALEKFMLESSLRHALERQEFLLYYQPQVSLATGEIVGVEALLRWQHPELGLVSPAQFIPVAEETGLMRAIDEWVLFTACELAQSWYASGLRLSMTVNLSGRTFGESRLIEMIARALGGSGLSPERLELEITESAVMENAEATVNMLGNLKRMGIRLAVDDFGTGYSSLSYLKRFPIDTLKIDQSFVRDVTHDEDDASIVAAIIAMGHSLKLNVIAEGVETQDQLAFLRRQDCDGMQGYLFSRPLPAEEVTRLIRAGKKL